MRGAEPVNDEFEVGFDQTFEAGWFRIELAGRARIVDGTPVVVFENGAFSHRRMTVLRLTQQDIMTAACQRGLMRLDQVRYAVAERDGKISIVEEDKA